MEAVGAIRSSASAQLSPAASTDRLDLGETGGSLAIVGDGSGVAKACSVAATGSTILLSRNHCTITVLIARRAKRVACGASFGRAARVHTLVALRA
jgi:hypothetical protein